MDSGLDLLFASDQGASENNGFCIRELYVNSIFNTKGRSFP